MTPAVHVETHQSASAGEPRPHPIVNPGMVMTVGHSRGYPLLPLKPGVSIAEGDAAWRTFTRTADDVMLGLAENAARAAWPDDPMIHDLVYTPLTSEREEAPMGLIDGLERLRAMQRETDALNERTAAPYVPDIEYDDEDDEFSLEKLLAGCCTPGKPCGDHFDDVFGAWRAEQEDRHFEVGTPPAAT